MSSANPSPHLHAASLAALLARDPAGRSKSQVAAVEGFTPANLREFETGVRTGARESTRARVAAAVGVPVAAITCWCDRPEVDGERRCRSVLEETP